MTTSTAAVLTSDEMLAAATEMAASGQYDGALGLLDRAEQTESSSRDLRAKMWLLRAKVHAQRRDFRQSLPCWERVLDITPDNEEARLGQALCERMVRSPLARYYLKANAALAGMAALVIILGIITVWQALRHPAASREMVDAAARPMVDALSRQHSEIADFRGDAGARDQSMRLALYAMRDELRGDFQQQRDELAAGHAKDALWRGEVNDKLTGIAAVNQRLDVAESSAQSLAKQTQQLSTGIDGIGAAFDRRALNIERDLSTISREFGAASQHLLDMHARSESSALAQNAVVLSRIDAIGETLRGVVADQAALRQEVSRIQQAQSEATHPLTSFVAAVERFIKHLPRGAMPLPATPKLGEPKPEHDPAVGTAAGSEAKSK